MMRTIYFLAAVAGTFGMAGCGVPREAGVLAAQHAAAVSLPADDASVRQRLQGDVEAWSALEQLLEKHEFGGITGVDAGFVQLVDQTAALAKREGDLIAQGQDDAAMNRQALQHFNELWQSADRYLNQ